VKSKTVERGSEWEGSNDSRNETKVTAKVGDETREIEKEDLN